MSASRSSHTSRSLKMRLQDRIFRIMSAAHVGLYRLSGGRIGGRMFGAPILVLTTTGRKTGKPRSTPLMYLRDGDELVIVASKGGAPHDPVWWLNLKQTPEAEVLLGRSTLRVHAEQASPEQRQRLWPRVTAMYKGYAEYQTKTTREIPLAILRPMPEAQSTRRR